MTVTSSPQLHVIFIDVLENSQYCVYRGSLPSYHIGPISRICHKMIIWQRTSKRYHQSMKWRSDSGGAEEKRPFTRKAESTSAMFSPANHRACALPHSQPPFQPDLQPASIVPSVINGKSALYPSVPAFVHPVSISPHRLRWMWQLPSPALSASLVSASKVATFFTTSSTTFEMLRKSSGIWLESCIF